MANPHHPHRWPLLGALALLASPGCIRSMAVNTLGDALAESGGSFARDDDPELVRDASAFGLKTMESLLESEPEHRGLLLAAARGFTQYAYAFFDSEANYIEADDFERAEHMKRRAIGFYRRAVRYGLRGLDAAIPGFAERLRADHSSALAEVSKEEVPLLFWTAAAWASVVGLDKSDELAADLDIVGPIVERARALDPDFDAGALHDFMLSWDASRPAAMGGTLEHADRHLAKALAASGGRRLAPLVTYAQLVCVARQVEACFREHLDRVLAFDVDSAPEHRLANLVSQKKARWLLGRLEDLFL